MERGNAMNKEQYIQLISEMLKESNDMVLLDFVFRLLEKTA